MYTEEPCMHLDTETNLCKVYERRHEEEPDCMSLTEHLVRTLNWLPEECAYVEYIRQKDTLLAVRAASKTRNKDRHAGKRRR